MKEFILILLVSLNGQTTRSESRFETEENCASALKVLIETVPERFPGATVKGKCVPTDSVERAAR